MGVYISQHQTDSAPKRASESNAEFFERVAGPFWDQVRNVINEWWSHFPPDDPSGLLSRLRDRNSDVNVFSALWELYLHEMLIRSNCTVKIEQEIGKGDSRPDFLVTRGDERFAIEARWTAERLGGTGDSIPPQVKDAIDCIPSPNFSVSYKVEAVGLTTPSQKRLKNELPRWLASLDPDLVTAEYEQKIPLPRYVWREAGWGLTFEAIPRSPERRGNPASRTISIHPSVWVADDSRRVFEAVKNKGGKYGDLDLPFIVAIGNAALFHEDEDIESALYGTSVEYEQHTEPTFARNSDGYWIAAQARTHSRVSGVLVVDNPAPWTWTKKIPVLWQSAASGSLPAPVLPSWETAKLVDNHVERQPATRPVHTALGLPERWPSGEAFPQHRPRKTN
ncbi:MULTISPECIES: hypothetical protein [unclassified Streptomyces]|uniref:hypothetical protein n=1 Tax=unclassified Streptomyces TaxID=2593676 RepID=UPI001F23C3A5|nr:MULTISPECIES: hypothetical protein [unclassified Streptomyces]